MCDEEIHYSGEHATNAAEKPPGGGARVWGWGAGTSGWVHNGAKIPGQCSRRPFSLEFNPILGAKGPRHPSVAASPSLLKAQYWSMLCATVAQYVPTRLSPGFLPPQWDHKASALDLSLRLLPSKLLIHAPVIDFLSQGSVMCKVLHKEANDKRSTASKISTHQTRAFRCLRHTGL